MPSFLGAQGQTILVAVAPLAPAGLQCPNASGTTSYLLYNDGTVTVFMAADKTSAGAQQMAVIPVAGTSAEVYPVPAKSYLPVTDVQNAFWSGVTAAGGTASVFVTPVAAQNT